MKRKKIEKSFETFITESILRLLCDPSYKTKGSILEEYRSRNFTQEAFAKRCSIDIRVLRKCEHGIWPDSSSQRDNLMLSITEALDISGSSPELCALLLLDSSQKKDAMILEYLEFLRHEIEMLCN